MWPFCFATITPAYLRCMSTKIVIDTAEPADAPSLLTLVNSAYRGDSSRKGWTTEADLLDGIRIDVEGLYQMFNNPNATLLKANTADTQLVGCVYLEQKDAAMYLGMLTVQPDLQNAGIGKQLLAAGEELARAKGCTEIMMTVISERKELIGWYQTKGYLPTGEQHPFPDDPRFGIPKQSLSFIVMKKQLNYSA